MLEKTVFFGKYHQRLEGLVTMKEELLASYTMRARFSSTLNLLSGKPPEVQFSLPILIGQNNLRKIPGAFRNKGYIGSLFGFYKT